MQRVHKTGYVQLKMTHPWPMSSWRWPIPDLCPAEDDPSLTYIQMKMTHPWPMSRWRWPIPDLCPAEDDPSLTYVQLKRTHPWPMTRWRGPIPDQCPAKNDPSLNYVQLKMTHPWPMSNWRGPIPGLCPAEDDPSLTYLAPGPCWLYTQESILLHHGGCCLHCQCAPSRLKVMRHNKCEPQTSVSRNHLACWVKQLCHSELPSGKRQMQCGSWKLMAFTAGERTPWWQTSHLLTLSLPRPIEVPNLKDIQMQCGSWKLTDWWLLI